MSSLDNPDVRRRILANARAAEMERLRNVARQELGADATEYDIETRARDLVRQKLSAAGSKGRALQAERQQAADRVRAIIPALEELLLAALDAVRSVQQIEETEPA